MNIKQLCLLVFLCWAAYVDWKEYRIPNLLIISALICRGVLGVLETVAFHNQVDVMWEMYISELLAGGLVIVAAIAFYGLCSKTIGAGDFKLLFVMALFLGIEAFLNSLIASSLVAFIVIIYLLLIKRIKKSDAIPLAPFFASGVVLFYICRQIYS